MALGITAWVTSRKWTLGPSYVNNSRVIETLPGCHWGPSPAPATHCIHLLACDRASVTTDHFRDGRPTAAPRAEASSLIGGDTITVFCHNYPPHERLLLGRGIGATKNKQRRGMCCYLWHGTMCPGPGPGHGTDDHWSPGLRSAWEREGDHVVTSSGGSSGDYELPVSSILLIQTFPSTSPHGRR